MRQQQNRRSNKNRNNHQRKFSNILSKIFESNGPGIKIRGTAQTIYEKYTSLARDAQTSGDNITAENFLQHAEHYKRIIIEASPNYYNKAEENAIMEDDLTCSEAEIEKESQKQESSEDLQIEVINKALTENSTHAEKPKKRRKFNEKAQIEQEPAEAEEDNLQNKPKLKRQRVKKTAVDLPKIAEDIDLNADESQVE